MNNTIYLFDSLLHVDLSDTSFDSIRSQMKEQNILCAFAVGMDGYGKYDENSFSKIISQNFNNLFPVAYYYFEHEEKTFNIHKKLKGLVNLGYVGIKLHPRYSRIDITSSTLAEIIRQAGQMGLVVLLCTYFYTNKVPFNTIDNLAFLINQIEDTKLILLHAGSVRLLETIELTRAFSNILLDLSFTLCKYEGSSIDLDIEFAFRTFDKRICVGSDYPEFSLGTLRKRFDYFSCHIPLEKRINIAHRNLANFTNLGGQYFER